VHAIGVCLGLIGVKIVGIAVNIERIEIAAILVYVIGLVTMLVLCLGNLLRDPNWRSLGRT
jgi:hypothetical protein